MSEDTSESDKIFQIKKLDNGETKVEVDGRKTVSPFNSVKHLKYASKIDAVCDTCRYRSAQAGGRGGCSEYKAGSVCTIRKDTKKLCAQLDTRDPATIDWMLGKIVNEGFETIMLAFNQVKMDGNIPDKNLQREINNFVKILQLWNELKSKTKVTAVKAQFGSDDDFQNIFQMIMSESQKKDGNKNG